MEKKRHRGKEGKKKGKKKKKKKEKKNKAEALRDLANVLAAFRPQARSQPGGRDDDVPGAWCSPRL